ncbi:hypothetical protein IFM89_011364 [Coptis chinensis]|uniref:Transposase MuDR plant domain-containing protein n=1 Tax=Coptis chinensis TaxID=261450 RepID=A0A835HMD8_9MAGN|nr:hypothetical protein IFM89_011364 [Coptis chinensis]
MKNLAIYQKFSYVQVRNNKTRIHLKCKNPECGWRVYCTVMSDKHTFKLRNYVETHSCEADGKNKNAQATCGWVADKLEGFLRSHLQMKPKDLILEVLDKFGVGISYYTAWKAKVRVLERINDRQKGLIDVVDFNFLFANHRFYFGHMYKNFKSEFKGDYLQSLSWAAAKAYKVPKHRKELACEMADNELIAAVRDVIERLEKKHTRYCRPFCHVNAFRATYGGYIFPFDNEEDWGKVKPRKMLYNLHHSRDIRVDLKTEDKR